MYLIFPGQLSHIKCSSYRNGLVWDEFDVQNISKPLPLWSFTVYFQNITEPMTDGLINIKEQKGRVKDDLPTKHLVSSSSSSLITATFSFMHACFTAKHGLGRFSDFRANLFYTF